jgi:site-specific DNA recombinase
MKLVGYIRVSTQEQADNTSLADQRKKIKSYCAATGHELVEVIKRHTPWRVATATNPAL